MNTLREHHPDVWETWEKSLNEWKNFCPKNKHAILAAVGIDKNTFLGTYFMAFYMVQQVDSLYPFAFNQQNSYPRKRSRIFIYGSVCCCTHYFTDLVIVFISVDFHFLVQSLAACIAFFAFMAACLRYSPGAKALHRTQFKTKIACNGRHQK